jgi:hypothetical protein
MCRKRVLPGDSFEVSTRTPVSVARAELVALTLVMENRLALEDAVRVLMVREGLDRGAARSAIVRAAGFASDEYGGQPLNAWVGEAV